MYTVYGKPNCPNCLSAKAMLEQKGIDYKYVDVMLDDGALTMLKSIGAKSVPQVFLNEHHIGDFAALKKVLETM